MENIVDFFSSFSDLVFEKVSEIVDSINGIITFFQKIIDLFSEMLGIFPSPFSSVVKLFLTLLGAIFLWKLYKAGG